MSASRKTPAAKKAKPKAAKPKTFLAYKGFDKDMVCHPSGGKRIQYVVGGTYTHDGPVTRCGAGGFHSCEYPLNVFGYYAPAGNRFAVVEIGGQIDRSNDDTKIASSVLTVKAELSLAGLIKAAIEYTTSRAKPVKGSVSRKDLGAASATGDQGAASATGYRGAAMASGYGGKVMGNEGCALFLVERNDAYEIIAVWAGIAGSDGIKAGTWYTLRGGKPVEVTA